MSTSTTHAYGIEHPAPQRGNVGRGFLFAALLSAPLAWLVELSINYALASQACFPRARPRAVLPPAWNWLQSALLSINLLALAIAVIGTVMSFYIWKRTGGEGSGGHTHLIEAGEGRTRFLAVWGIWSGIWFIINIGFNTGALLGVPPCTS